MLYGGLLPSSGMDFLFSNQVCDVGNSVRCRVNSNSLTSIHTHTQASQMHDINGVDR